MKRDTQVNRIYVEDDQVIVYFTENEKTGKFKMVIVTPDYESSTMIENPIIVKVDDIKTKIEKNGEEI